MGLSASQARLLTITSRKSDCEFQSMRLSHEKIALSRSMTDISNEYQNSLNQTKLVYDFYGTNDKSTDVSYGLFMQPSEFNGYMPIITTDASGKIVLDSKYAMAAKAAGIPAEGLGTLPSKTSRDRFLESLCATNIITQAACESYLQVPYSQTIGVGDIESVSEVTTTMSYNDLIEYLKSVNVNLSDGADFSAVQYDIGGSEYYHGDDWEMPRGVFKDYNVNDNVTNVSIGDILEGNSEYTLMYKCGLYDDGSYDGVEYNRSHVELLSCDVMQNYWNIAGNGGYELLQALREVLNVSTPEAQTALNYADMMIQTVVNLADNVGNDWRTGIENHETVLNNKNSYTIGGIAGSDSEWFYNGSGYKDAPMAYMSDSIIINNTDKYVGYYVRSTRPQCHGNSAQASVSINIGNVLKAYLTYFADAINEFNGIYSVDNEKDDLTVWKSNGQMFQKNGATVQSSKLVGETDNTTGQTRDFSFDVVIEQQANTSDALMSSFYDAIFNQICLRGWMENNNVTDKEYLQDMYKNGMLFVTATSEDGFYYQKNYGSYSYIKEVTDDDAIARAEAKYNTEKAKLNHKEEILDLKMKNLDTEINSLTTEYDTIKSLITKNIERGFKRYEA